MSCGLPHTAKTALRGPPALSAPIISASVCLLFDILLPLSFVRNHTRTCSECGEQVSLLLTRKFAQLSHQLRLVMRNLFLLADGAGGPPFIALTFFFSHNGTRVPHPCAFCKGGRRCC